MKKKMYVYKRWISMGDKVGRHEFVTTDREPRDDDKSFQYIGSFDIDVPDQP